MLSTEAICLIGQALQTIKYILAEIWGSKFQDGIKSSEETISLDKLEICRKVCSEDLKWEKYMGH
jgi:hypothetical protein